MDSPRGPCQTSRMDPDILHDGRYSWFRLGVSLAIGVVGNVGMWAIVLILPAVQSEFGLDRASAALPYTLTMAGFAVGNLVIGRAVDRFGITAALSVAALASATGYFLAAATQSVAALSAIQFLIGLGTSACFGPLIADVSHWFLRRRGIAVAVAACGNYLSGAIWPLLLSGVLETQGWRAVYAILGSVALGLMIPLALLLRRRMPASAEAIAGARAASLRASAGLSPNAIVLLLGLAGIGCCVAMSMPQVHIVAYCVDLGYGPAIGAEMLSLMLFGGVLSRLASGFLADRIGGLRTLLIGSVLQGLALFLYLPAGGLVSLYVVSAIFGLSQGGIVPAYAMIVRDYLPPKEAGARVGFVMMATIAGMALGGWMSGWIYDATGSYRMAFLNGIGWNVMNLGIVLLLLTRSRPRAGVPA